MNISFHTSNIYYFEKIVNLKFVKVNILIMAKYRIFFKIQIIFDQLKNSLKWHSSKRGSTVHIFLKLIEILLLCKIAFFLNSALVELKWIFVFRHQTFRYFEKFVNLKFVKVNILVMPKYRLFFKIPNIFIKLEKSLKRHSLKRCCTVYIL